MLLASSVRNFNDLACTVEEKECVAMDHDFLKVCFNVRRSYNFFHFLFHALHVLQAQDQVDELHSTVAEREREISRLTAQVTQLESSMAVAKHRMFEDEQKLAAFNREVASLADNLKEAQINLEALSNAGEGSHILQVIHKNDFKVQFYLGLPSYECYWNLFRFVYDCFPPYHFVTKKTKATTCSFRGAPILRDVDALAIKLTTRGPS